MKGIRLLVLIEGLVIIFLLFLLLTEKETGPVVENSGLAPLSDKEGQGPEPLKSDKSTHKKTPEPKIKEERTTLRREYEEKGIGILLYGEVRDKEGKPVKEPHIHLVPPTKKLGRYIYVKIFNNTWTLGGLVPGTWTLKYRAKGYKDSQKILKLEKGALKRRVDIIFEKSPAVHVKLLLENKGQLSKYRPGKHLFGYNHINVIATKESPPKKYSDTPYDILYPKIGVGKWYTYGSWATMEEQKKRDSEGISGVLYLLEPPPLFASALYRNYVLKTLPLEPGEKLLVFNFQKDEILSFLSTVRFKIVDYETGKPMEGVTCDMGTYQSSAGGGIGKSKKDGSVVIEYVIPGMYKPRFSKIGYADIGIFVTVKPGTKNDFGVIRLSPPVRVTGKVTNSKGEKVFAKVSYYMTNPGKGILPIDTLSSGPPTKKDGTFTIKHIGRTKYIFWAKTTDGRLGKRFVDTSAGNVQNVNIVVQEPTKVTLKSPRSRSKAFLVRGLDESGIPVVSFFFRTAYPPTFPLPPGIYTFEMYDDQKLIKTVPLKLGKKPALIEL